MNLALIDLDGVVADSSERFARATIDGKINWDIAFDPDLVHLDVLIDEVWAALDWLIGKGYTINFLTSRPESMRDATQAWLDVHSLDGYPLLMKPKSAQYVKTVLWKAGEVQLHAGMPGVESVIFVDDEAQTREAVKALVPNAMVFASLAELVDDRPIII